jgi:hypothetical protein
MIYNEPLKTSIVEVESDLSISWAEIEEKLFASQVLHSGKRILRLEKGLYVIFASFHHIEL